MKAIAFVWMHLRGLSGNKTQTHRSVEMNTDKNVEPVDKPTQSDEAVVDRVPTGCNDAFPGCERKELVCMKSKNL